MYVRRNKKATFRRKTSNVACGLSSIKMHCSVKRLNEVYVCSIKHRSSDILLKTHTPFIAFVERCNRLFRCNRPCYCTLYWHCFFDVIVTLCHVSVTSAKYARDVHRKSNSTEKAEVFSIDTCS